MSTPKRHLVTRWRWHAVCGVHNPAHWTRDPSEVDCARCAGTEAMALAELRAANRKPKRRLGPKRKEQP